MGKNAAATAKAQARVRALLAELSLRAQRGTFTAPPPPANDNGYVNAVDGTCSGTVIIPPPDEPIPFCPHTPTTKQRELHALDDTLEVFFGGAARGGKTDGALQSALRYVHVPGYAALICRRNYNQLTLPDGVLARANEWLGGKTGVRWDHELPGFVFDCPGGGTSSIAFGHLEREESKYRYQGARLQLIVMEELTHFTASQYRYMFSRLSRPSRGALSQVPLRMRSTGNPGGVGHFWVWARFINVETREVGAVFLPSFLADNPHEDQIAYRASLAKLSPVEQAQLLDGIWDALQEGDVFKTDRITLIDVMPPNLTALVRYWDCAATPEPTSTGERKDGGSGKGDFTASCWMGLASDRSFVILDATEDKWDVGELPDRMLLQADEDGRATAVRVEEEGGHSGKLATRVYQEHLRGYSVDGIRSTGSKLERAKPLSAAVYNRKLSIVRGPKTRKLLQYLHAYPYVSHDDMIDACSGAYNHLAADYVGDFKIETVRTTLRTAGLRQLMGASTRGLRMG